MDSLERVKFESDLHIVMETTLKDDVLMVDCMIDRDLINAFPDQVFFIKEEMPAHLEWLLNKMRSINGITATMFDQEQRTAPKEPPHG